MRNIASLGFLVFFLGCHTSSTSVNDAKNGTTAATLSSPSKPTTVASEKVRALIPELCKKLDESIVKYKWSLKTCQDIEWQAEATSVEGRPLIYTEFGDRSSPNVTLILSMVHPDEITPLYLGFKLTHWVREHESALKNSHVVVAPFLNPDGFFKKPPIRMNSKGVDLNRNFATSDWKTKALQTWKTKLGKNPRRFPGWEPRSEPETHFQEELIQRFKPKKILSIHAPLNVTDYDGPNSLALDRFPKEYVQACLALRTRLRAKSTGFFPGSLGNFAGQELGIPTITLELPSADFRKADLFWKKFQPGIQSMIEYRIDEELAKANTSKKNP